MGFRDYEVTEECLAQARRLGLYGNVAKRVARMAKRSAPFTHPRANRRFEGYLLKIEKGKVVAITKFDPDTGMTKDDVIGEATRRIERRARILAATEKHFGKGALKKK